MVSCVHVCSLPGRASKAQGGSKCALHSEDSELTSFITGLVGLGGEHLPLLAHVRVSSGDMLAECIATLEVSGALCSYCVHALYIIAASAPLHSIFALWLRLRQRRLYNTT